MDFPVDFYVPVTKTFMANVYGNWEISVQLAICRQDNKCSKSEGCRNELMMGLNTVFFLILPPLVSQFYLLLGFSQLYMVTILRSRQEERNATRFKMLQKTYIYIEREERKHCPCKQLVCG